MDPLADDIRLARGGDADAIGRLIEGNLDHLKRLAEQQLRRSPQGRRRVSEILQCTFLDLVRSIRDFEGESQAELTAWLDHRWERVWGDDDGAGARVSVG